MMTEAEKQAISTKRVRAWRIANPERYKEQCRRCNAKRAHWTLKQKEARRLWRIAHPENKQNKASYYRRYYAAHLEKCRKRSREQARKSRALHWTFKPRHAFPTIHGMSRTPEYRAYYSAQARCTKPATAHYECYGGRGIKFLFTSFEEFIAHIGLRPEGTTLDRINNDGNYELGNVRWATPTLQAHNRREPGAATMGDFDDNAF